MTKTELNRLTIGDIVRNKVRLGDEANTQPGDLWIVKEFNMSSPSTFGHVYVKVIHMSGSPTHEYTSNTIELAFDKYGLE